MSIGSFSFKVELDEVLDVELLSPSSVIVIVCRVNCDRIPIFDGTSRGNGLDGVDMEVSISPQGKRALSKEK